jgi:hypothetical protein
MRLLVRTETANGKERLTVSPEIVRIGAAYLRLSVKDNGEQAGQESGRIGRGTVDILVDPCLAHVILHVFFFH